MIGKKSKLRMIESLSDALVKEVDNVATITKALHSAGITNQALVESFAEMESERDLYRMAFNIAIGRLAAYSKAEGSTQVLIQEILSKALAEIENERS